MQDDDAGIGAAATLPASAERRSPAHDQISAIVYRNIDEVVYHVRVEANGRYRFQFVNPAFYAATQLTPQQVIGQLVRSVIPEPSCSLVLRYYDEAICTRSTVRWQEVTDYPTGRKVGAVSVTPVFDGAGHCTDLIGTVHDITELTRRQEALAEANASLQSMADLMERRAHYDSLTGLPNRSLFNERLRGAIEQAQQAADSVTLLILDLDRFKEVNDMHGHGLGDVVLIDAARRIDACLGDGETAARLGGDEFTVILRCGARRARVTQVCEAILQALSVPFDVGGEHIHLNASIGVATFPNDAATPEELMRNADLAMYGSKQAGRARFTLFDRAMQHAALNKANIVSDLRSAVADGKLELFFQPIVDLRSGAIFKAEALVRWRREPESLVLPGEFIAFAEDAGLIHEIGNWVFCAAARSAKRWSDLLGRQFKVAINKSPVQFTHPHPMDWSGYLDEIALPRDSVTIEITEGVLLSLSERVIERLHALHASGFEVSIDDFGTGYSSMSYLKRLDIDYLKIDRSFVADMLINDTARIITETIILMAHKLGLKVIAEGVETVGQRDWLVGQGCDYAQGYYFSHPLAEGTFEQLLLGGPVVLA
ncbi:MAG: EAL domain-containing protein [Pseudomonadota bacterium]|nr:EAL domain-containing protein [Pseudomonadota bacterium]